MLTIHLCVAPLGLDRYSPDNLRCLTAPARAVTALRAYCFNRLTRHLGQEHKRDKHMHPHLSIPITPRPSTSLLQRRQNALGDLFRQLLRPFRQKVNIVGTLDFF